MVSSRIVGIQLILVITFGGIYCENSGKVRDRRVTSPRKVKVEKFMNKGDTIDCFEAFDKCRKTPKCKAALRGMKKKCTVVSNNCSKNSLDLPKCGKVMDELFTHGFSEKRCSCRHNMLRCFQLLNKIYANPCFVTIRNDRIKKELAEKAKSRSRHVKTNIERIIELDALSVDDKRGNYLPDELVFNENDVIFGDDGFYEPRPLTRLPPELPLSQNTDLPKYEKPESMREEKNEIDIYIEEFRKKYKPKPVVEKEEVTTRSDESSSNGTIWQNQIFNAITLEIKNERSDIEENSKIYEPIAISLGIVFGAALLVTVIFLLLKRTKGIALYKKGKKVTKQSDNGA